MRSCRSILALVLTGLVAHNSLAADSPLASREESIADPAWLRQELEPIRQKHHFPALAAALVVDGKVVAASAVGVRRWGSPQKITRDDSFHLGSVAKTMTATMIARMVDKNVIRWNTTLSQMFPELDATMNPAYRNVTVVQLLSHSSGMPYQPRTAEAVTDGRGITLQDQRYEYTKAALADPPEVAPGTKVVYGGGPVIVTSALERITKKSYEDLMREEVFGPLGMTTAGFGAEATPGTVDGTWDHQFQGTEPVPVAPDAGWARQARAPVGRNVHCSVIDLARFCAIHVKPGKYLSRQSVSVLHSPVSPVFYAPGWALGDVNWAKGTILWHSGSMGRNFALAHVVPQEGFSAAVLTNIDGEGVHAACDEVNLRLVAKLRSGKAGAKLKGSPTRRAAERR